MGRNANPLTALRDIRDWRWFTGTGPPASGRYHTGDRMLNLSNARGAPVMWKCVQGGEPGTWETVRALHYDLSVAEMQLGIAPSDYTYPLGHVKRYGAALDNYTNDYTAIQNAINAVKQAGGGYVFGFEGATARCNTAPVVDSAFLDLEGGALRLVLTGTGGYDYGLRLRDGGWVLNGEVTVESSGEVGDQAGIHAAINVGALNGDGGTVAAPSADEGVSGWGIWNVKASTNRAGKVAVQVTGGANHGFIDQLEVPDSATMFGALHFDWGFLGTISSSDVPGSRTNFNAGSAYTTHPNNIAVGLVKIGALSRTKAGTDTGAHGVRVSGGYNIGIKKISAAQTTYATFRHTAGDLGFEFAPAAVKPFAHKNVVVEDVVCENCTDSWLGYVDCHADNLETAITGGYSALTDPIGETNLEIRHAVGVGSAGANVTDGIRFDHIRGGKAVDVEVRGFKNGVLVDEKCYGTQIIRPVAHRNREHGVHVHHGTNKPEDILVEDPVCYLNGQDAGFANPAGVKIDGSKRARVVRGQFGHRTAASETTQTIGLWIETNAEDAEAEGAYVHSVKAGGTAYSLMASSTDYGKLRLFRGNSCAAAITNKIGGLNILPVEWKLGADGVMRGTYECLRASLTADTTPTAGAWLAGEYIRYLDPVAGGYEGTKCMTSGSQGAWKRVGAVEA